MVISKTTVNLAFAEKTGKISLKTAILNFGRHYIYEGIDTDRQRVCVNKKRKKVEL